jgi:hypothetical protein
VEAALPVSGLASLEKGGDDFTGSKSAKTPELSTVHRPLGTHGLWGRKTDQLPALMPISRTSLMP